jgi:hypothetical protein
MSRAAIVTCQFRAWRETNFVRHKARTFCKMLRFKVFTAVAMKNAVFWYAGQGVLLQPTFRRTEERVASIFSAFLRSVVRLLVTANVVPS